MDFTELKDKVKRHKWRMRFALLPVKRIKLVDGFIEEDGYYFWRIVIEVECGLIPTWTAYAHFNDGVKFSGGV